MSGNIDPYLRLNDDLCLICGKELGSDWSTIAADGWQKLQSLAREWSLLPLKPGNDYYEFTLVHSKISGKKDPFGKRHRKNKCRANFYKKALLDKLRKKYDVGHTELEEGSSSSRIEDSLELPGNVKSLPTTSNRTRSTTGNTMQFAHICFICNEVRASDSNKYREGGLGVCEFESAAERLQEAMNSITEMDEFHVAKERFQILISGESKDIYSAEVRYHKSCYKLFTYLRPKADQQEVIQEKLHTNALADFLSKIDSNIIQKRNAYLLNDLLNDWLFLCDDRGFTPRINHSHHLKKAISDRFPDSIGFFKSGKHVIVYSQFMNPCEYSVSTLKGKGMRDSDIIRSFANMIKRKVRKEELNCPDFPFTPMEVIEEANKGPMCELYNTIFMTLHESVSINDYGYCGTSSRNLANKIWSLACDWEALIRRNPNYRNPKQVLMGMNIYRLTRSKKIITYLSKSNFSISYRDILKQNKAWDEMVKEGKGGTIQLKKGQVTHSSIDNVDEETESISIHFTNSNLFQPNIGQSQNEENEMINVERYHPGTTEELPDYQLGKRNDPKPFPDYIDIKSTELLEKRLSIDILWSIAGGILDFNGEQLPILGPWTHFMKGISSVNFKETVIQYMPVVPQPVSDYAVLKAYLLFLLESTNNLEIKHIFAHCDEAVYSKLLEIIWNHGDKFQEVIPIMGGFHQIMNLQKLLYKRYACLGLDKWISEAGTTKSTSAAEKAVHGTHYNTSTRVYKEILDAIIQMRTEDITDNYKGTNNELLTGLIELRKTVSMENVNKVLEMEEYHHLQDKLLATTGTQSKMTVMLLKDISLMLSFIVSAREANIDLHLECERQFLNLAHAFDHVNYARWGSFQHVNMEEMRRLNTDAYKDLKTVGWTASQTGGKFNAVHGDYICERQNAHTKSTGGPIKSGVGTNVGAFNTWIRTRHIGVEMQNALRKILNIKMSSSSRDSTPAGFRRHSKNVEKLKTIIRHSYKYNFFENGPARAITTGQEIDVHIVTDLLTSAEKGNQCFETFTENRLKTNKVSFFHKITKNKIKTGIKKAKRSSKPIEVLKEDVQGFGILADQDLPLSEAFKYPITTIPLSIAESLTDLRGASTSSKSIFRNHIIKQTNSVSYSHPEAAVWIYDAGRVIRAVPPKNTYEQFFDAVLHKMTPPKESNPSSVHIVLDNYLEKSTKSGARKMRGENDSTRLHITGYGQTMPTTMTSWQSALANSKTKQSLFAIFCAYVLSGQAPIRYPTIINNVNETWMIDPQSKSVTKLFTCSHEEADTRMFYHASLQGKTNVVISANDSDVLILGTYACALDSERKWFFNHQYNSYADMRLIADILGNAALYLPQFHSLTGSDTTSYFYFRGKTGPWERAFKSPESFHLIEDLGKDRTPSNKAINDIKEFVRHIVYCGKSGESLVGTKVRMYHEQKKKRSSSLPPDPDSLKNDILRKHYQAYVWRRCLEPILDPLPFNEYGWKEVDGIIAPIWYTCPQLPPSRTLKDSSKSLHKSIELKVTTDEPPTKRSKGTIDDGSEEESGETYSSNESDDDSSEWEHYSEFSSTDDDSDW